MAISFRNPVTGEISTTPPKPTPVKNTRKSWGCNRAGWKFRQPILEWLKLNPSKTLKEIHAQFPHLNFHSIRYSVSRGVVLGIFGMTGKAKSAGKDTPRYFVIQQKQIDVAALLESIQ